MEITNLKTLTTCTKVQNLRRVQNKVHQVTHATVCIAGYSALLSSIEVNTTWIFFWFSKRLVSVAWDLLALNVT